MLPKDTARDVKEIVKINDGGAAFEFLEGAKKCIELCGKHARDRRREAAHQLPERLRAAVVVGCRFVRQPCAFGALALALPCSAALITLQIESPRAHDRHLRRMRQLPKVLEARRRIELSPEMLGQLLQFVDVLFGFRRAAGACEPPAEFSDALDEFLIGSAIDERGERPRCSVIPSELSEFAKKLLRSDRIVPGDDCNWIRNP